MITRRIFGTNQFSLLTPVKLLLQTNVRAVTRCPGSGKKGGAKSKACVCGGSSSKPPSGTGGGKKDSPGIVRHKNSGKCRLGFLPETWFTIFYTNTGVSGPYILLIGLGNYLCSKEILVMEHEYYTGLSLGLMVYGVATKFGKQIGAALDKLVQEKEDEWEQGRKDEIAGHKKILSEGKLAQVQARSQEILMAAKKENIAMQLEAVYRERMMTVFKAVRDRLQYHAKKTRSVGRIEQKWMVQWILENVNKGITPELKKEAMSSAIRDLAGAAAQIK